MPVILPFYSGNHSQETIITGMKDMELEIGVTTPHQNMNSAQFLVRDIIKLEKININPEIS